MKRILAFLLLSLAALSAYADEHPPWTDWSKTRLKVIVSGRPVVLEGWLLQNGTLHYYPDDPFNAAALKGLATPAKEFVGPPIPAVQRDEPKPEVKPPAAMFGVDEKKVFTGRVQGILANTPESKVYAAQIGATEPDKKLCVTVIGTEAECDKVTKDLRDNPAFTGTREFLNVQSYRPNEWAVDPALGFRSDGTPTITIQDSVGRELWRASDYAVGPEGLAKEIAAQLLRLRDANYDPAKTPGPDDDLFGFWRRAEKCPLGFKKDEWPLLAVTVGIVVVLWYQNKKG